MALKIVWSSRDWAEVIAELPAEEPLPCRTVLVPLAGMAHVLRRELIRSGQQRALAGTRFVSPRVAAMEVLRNHGVEFVPGEEALRETRLSALFRSNLSLRHFPIDLLRSAPGWEAAFGQSISDLEGARLRPDDIVADSAQLEDVLAVWRALDQSAQGSWTTQRIYVEAAITLEQRPELWPFVGSVLVHAGSQLSAAEARFIRAIPGATIGLSVARPVRKRYLDRIEKLFGAEAAAKVQAAQAPRGGKTERDLLVSYLFEPPVVLADPNRLRSSGPDGTVDLEEHMGLDAELEATADWVARQIANGAPLEEIAVLAPTTDPFIGLIADRLERLPWYDGPFPVYIANGLPLTHFATGARLLAVLRALRGHLAADLLADLLAALRLAGESERHLARGTATDLLWSLGTVGGNPAYLDGALEWSLRARERQAALEKEIADKEVALNQGNEDLDYTVRHSRRLLSDLRALRPALDALVTIARSTIENAPLSALWPMLREFFEQWLLQPGNVHHTILNDGLDTLSFDSTCGSVSGDDALKVIEDAILSTRVPMARFGEPAVYVGTVHDAAGLCFAAVRVIGLTEGRLPSLPREDPVLPDALRQQLNGRHGPRILLPLTADRAVGDLHALDNVVRGTERVIALSSPRLDAERSEREPSSVILEAAAALARPNRITGKRGAAIPDRTALTRDAFVPARTETNRFREQFPLTETAWQDGVAKAVIGVPRRWRKAAALDLEHIERLASDVAAGPMDGMLGTFAGEVPVPGLSPDYPISATAIAELLACPHAFFLGRLLYFEEPSEAPSQREIGQPYYGSFFHEIAAKFYADNGSAFCAHKDSLNHWLDVADRLVESLFKAFLKKYPLVGDRVRAQQQRRLRSDVRDLITRDWDRLKGLRVIVEKSFGYPAAAELKVGTKTFYLRGRIDRIEIAKNKAVIRDLKTARAHPRTGDEAGATPALDVQIAVYGLIAELLKREWQLPAQIEAGYAYFGRPGGERVFGADFETALKPAANEWLQIAVDLLTERQFPRTPNGEDCRYCPFQAVCGDGAYERASFLLENSRGAVASFAAMKLASGEES